MAKVIQFPVANDPAEIVEALEYLVEKARIGEIKSFVFAAKCEDGNVATQYGAADWGTRGELVGHIQVDIMWSMVQANADRL